MNVNDGYNALSEGRLQDARAIFWQSYDDDPGRAAVGLAWISIAEEDFERAENFSRTAIENGETLGWGLLVEAIGAQGRRAEAAALAENSLQRFSDNAYLYIAYAEQLVRTGEWDEGARRAAHALLLDRVGETDGYLRRLLTDLTLAYAAGKASEENVGTFLALLSEAAEGDPEKRRIVAEAMRAVAARERARYGPSGPPAVGGRAAGPPAIPPAAARPPEPRVSGPVAGASPRRERVVARRQMERTGRTNALEVDVAEMFSNRSAAPVAAHGPAAGGRPRMQVPPLVAVMRKDRAMNEELQSYVGNVGIPKWPSERQRRLDPLPVMRPAQLGDSTDLLRLNTLTLTRGDVNSEILIERARQHLLRALQERGALPPTLDRVGLAQLEVGLWYGVFELMREIPEIYMGKSTEDPRLLALGAFLGECLAREPDATWDYERQASASTVSKVGHAPVAPFEIAREWLSADDKDDVHLERIFAGLERRDVIPRIDPTKELSDSALTMKLAEEWLLFIGHPGPISQIDLASAMRPLNLLDDLLFFAIDERYLPPLVKGPGSAALSNEEGAAAFVRDTGEILFMGSRKHFARAAGIFLGELTPENAHQAVDMFTSFHRPRWSVSRDGDNRPAFLSDRNGTAVIMTTKQGRWRLSHTPDDPVPWCLTRA